jgi:N6-adenosine-specific RNA methylase IME4
MKETALVHFTQARVALQKAKTIDEVKSVRHAAERLRLYLKQVNESLEMQNDAAEIKLRAERRAGEMLKEGAKNGDRAGRGRPKKPSSEKGFSAPTLEEIGISEKQSFHWQSIAEIPEEEFEQVIEETKQAGEELTQRDILKVAKEIKQEKNKIRRTERIENIAEVSRNNTVLDGSIGKFPVIYCDPPWEYDFMGVDAWRVDNHYPTMTTDQICAEAVSEVTTKDAILFLWTTAPKLADAMRVISAWGFTYKTCAIWDKDWTGMGNYFRIQHELLLIATRGEIPPPETDNRPASIVRHKRSTKHSEKPDVFYDIIEAMYPELPKVELFARRSRKGWKFWGNETGGKK